MRRARYRGDGGRRRVGRGSGFDGWVIPDQREEEGMYLRLWGARDEMQLDAAVAPTASCLLGSDSSVSGEIRR